jgi:hypothetical protein
LFIHDLRNGLLKPDAIRTTTLDMSQYERLFATCRVPTDLGCRMETYDESRHIVVIRRGQFCEYRPHSRLLPGQTCRTCPRERSDYPAHLFCLRTAVVGTSESLAISRKGRHSPSFRYMNQRR